MLEADLEHHYHRDLPGEFLSIGCRKLWVLVSGLPPDSAVQRRGGQWTQDHELAAIAIERNDGWMRALVVGQGRKPEKVPAMPAIKHPDRARGAESEARKRMSTSQEIAGFLARLRR